MAFLFLWCTVRKMDYKMDNYPLILSQMLLYRKCRYFPCKGGPAFNSRRKDC